MKSSLLLLPLFLMGVSFAEDTAPPNIILAMADDQGWGDVGYNGHPIIQTPVLDQMAATGLRFDRFYAAAPVCSPTRGSVMTGRHPNRFGCFSWGYSLRPQEITVAEALKTAGYSTGHFGKWHLGSGRSESVTTPGNNGFDTWVSSPNFFENSPLFSQNGKVVEAKGESSMVTVAASLEFIREAKKNGKPFLAVIWFGSPHTPHIASKELEQLYKDHPKRERHYYGEITGIDRAMGKLREELKTLGLHDNTLIWYTSDNGSRKPGSTGGLRGEKGSLWEGGIRVPTVIEWPSRIKKHRITQTACNTVDIYPTLAELANVKVPKQVEPLDGTSLVSLIDGEEAPRAKPMGFWVYPSKGNPVRSRNLLQELANEQSGDAVPIITSKDPAFTGELDMEYSHDNRPGHAAWMEGDYKLHRIPQGSSFTYSLFNLKQDRNEKKNLAAEQPDRVKQMQQGLERWQKSVIDSLNGKDYITEK